MKLLEDLAAKDSNSSSNQNSDGHLWDGNSDGVLQSQETIKTYIKNFTENDKLDFTQGLMNFANKIDKRWLVDGLVMSLYLLATESAKIKVALLDQFIPMIQLV